MDCLADAECVKDLLKWPCLGNARFRRVCLARPRRGFAETDGAHRTRPCQRIAQNATMGILLSLKRRTCADLQYQECSARFRFFCHLVQGHSNLGADSCPCRPQDRTQRPSKPHRSSKLQRSGRACLKGRANQVGYLCSSSHNIIRLGLHA